MEMYQSKNINLSEFIEEGEELTDEEKTEILENLFECLETGEMENEL